MRISLLAALTIIYVCILPPAIQAAEGDGEYHLIFKDQRFEPADLSIPAGRRIKLIVENQSDIPVEFESFELNREKVVVPHGKVIIYLGPVDPGTYSYFNDFNRDTTGTLTARQ
jgi:hypothetical protein